MKIQLKVNLDELDKNSNDKEVVELLKISLKERLIANTEYKSYSKMILELKKRYDLLKSVAIDNMYDILSTVINELVRIEKPANFYDLFKGDKVSIDKETSDIQIAMKRTVFAVIYKRLIKINEISNTEYPIVNACVADAIASLISRVITEHMCDNGMCIDVEYVIPRIQDILMSQDILNNIKFKEVKGFDWGTMTTSEIDSCSDMCAGVIDENSIENIIYCNLLNLSKPLMLETEYISNDEFIDTFRNFLNINIRCRIKLISVDSMKNKYDKSVVEFVISEEYKYDETLFALR